MNSVQVINYIDKDTGIIYIYRSYFVYRACIPHSTYSAGLLVRFPVEIRAEKMPRDSYVTPI